MKVEINPAEVEFSAIRAQGPGGQNVNKVSCAVHARFDIAASSLPDVVKERLLAMRDSRITQEGVVVLKAQQSRSLEKNKDDALRRLQELEAAHPEHFDPNSPSQRVGGAPIEEFHTVIHDPPMLSIENAYTLEELREWHDRVRRGLGRDDIEYEAELKIDGVSISLQYENGLLTRGADPRR